MKIVETVVDLKQEIARQKEQGHKIGFVPTMGALHQGHGSLIIRAKKENDYCVVSIFVNPTQFNNLEDLQKYPRTYQADTALLKDIDCDLLFCPTQEEVYPFPDQRKFEFGHLDKVMEGAFRPGHFNGVAQVVSKLFDMVEPDCAYFGDKDFQQVAIVKAMVKKLQLPVEIISCPTIRESDGLAMSSRNARLSPLQREHAAKISQILFRSATLSTCQTIVEVKTFVSNSFCEDPSLRLEYFEIVDADTLQPIDRWPSQGEAVGCIAIYCGEVRLIDHIEYKF